MRSRTRFSRRTFVTSVILSGAVGLVAACSPSASPTLAPSPGASSGVATAAPSPATGQAAASPASPTAAAASTTAAKPSGQPVNLLFWYSWSVSDVPLKYYQRLADQTWAPKHPGSSLKIVKIPENDREAKYTAAFAAGQGPDLFSDMVDIYTQRGIAAALPSELGQRLAENLIPASIPNYQYEGKWRGIPFIPIGSLGLVMFYNADQFKEVGLDPAKPPTTMTELWDDALKLVNVDSSGNVTRSGFAHNFQSDLGAMTGKFYPFLHSYGGRLYDPKTVVATGFVNSPGGVQALQVLKDMSIGPKKVSSNTLGLTEEQMARGQASIIFRESSFVGYFQTHAPKLNLKISYVPKEKEEGCGNFTLNWALIANRASKGLAETFDFMSDMATAKVDLEVAKTTGTIPAWKSSWQDPYMTSRPDYAALQYTSTHDPGIRYLAPHSNEAAQAYGKIISSVARGELEPKAAADQVASQIDKILKG